MTSEPSSANSVAAARGKNIVIFSDGTGQRGGQFFDEARSNIYKLYRGTRLGPDSPIDPERQVAFYDPGLGTQPTDGELVTSTWRRFYNFLSQATGLGITKNIIDCYSAIIRLWQPGDRIYLFGFSRGAYTVRCLASVICLCGIPTRLNGGPLKYDQSSTDKIAREAVKSIYQHVSSPRDAKYHAQREELARLFRIKYSSADSNDGKLTNAYPFFIGVFDTVASLANRGSLIVLFVLYALLVWGMSAILAYSFPSYDMGYWAGWLIFDTICGLGALYIYTHLKFSFQLSGWWQTIHLTAFKQRFYDQALNPKVNYARHALSIDERRQDFKRVRWGGAQAKREAGIHKIEPMKQIWFSGNHADIGGGYSENESRLSDIALRWMIGEATNKALGDDALEINGQLLTLHPESDGLQHDETRSSVFRFAGKVERDCPDNATLHDTVLQRFQLPEVQQFDVKAKYRPEALRQHFQCKAYYVDVPAPNFTCRQRIKIIGLALKRAAMGWVMDFLNEKVKGSAMQEGHGISKAISCVGLAFLVVVAGSGIGIFGWQCVNWLITAQWIKMPLMKVVLLMGSGQVSWAGAQIILNWLYDLPLGISLVIVGFFLFWILGRVAEIFYGFEVFRSGKTASPAQIKT